MKNFSGFLGCLLIFSPYIFAAILLVGEIKCIAKAIKCDWEAPYRAEIIYTASALTGLGAVVGYLNIDDTSQ